RGPGSAAPGPAHPRLSRVWAGAGFPVIVLRYLAGLLDGASFEEEQPGFLGGTNIVRREPIGVVGAIVPWNYPQTLAAFKYGAALARRVHRGDEAEAGDGARRLPARRGHRRGRDPGRRDQHRPRRP